MRTRIKRIGNSHGVRIPKLLLELSNLTGEVEIEAVDNQIIIRSARRPREGWESAFTEMGRCGNDSLLDVEASAQIEWNAGEWQW